MKHFKKLIQWIDRFGKYWSLVALIIIVLPTLEAVVFRFLLNRPTTWTQELSTIVFGIYFMIGAAYCESRDSFISMDVFSMHYRGWALVVLEAAKFLCCCVFCYIMLAYGVPIALRTIQTMERSETLWGPYLWPSRIAIPIGIALFWIRSLYSCITKTRNGILYARGNKPDEN
jgi:TRAP-type C4-dicarboxylate transport system permease small subunit